MEEVGLFTYKKVLYQTTYFKQSNNLFFIYGKVITEHILELLSKFQISVWFWSTTR